MSAILRLTGNGSFKALLKEPHGRRRPDHPVGEYLGKAVATEDGLVDLAPPALLEQAGRIEAVFEKELAGQDRFRLITKRHVKTHNSWTHNAAAFVRGESRSQDGGARPAYVCQPRAGP